MTKLVITYGIPASGKSTFAKRLISLFSNWRRVNKDSIREMIIAKKHWNKTVEIDEVVEFRNQLVTYYLRNKINVIVDDTNLPYRGINYRSLKLIAEEIGNIEIIEKYFPISIEEAILRNKNLDRVPVPNEVIEYINSLLPDELIPLKTKTYIGDFNKNA